MRQHDHRSLQKTLAAFTALVLAVTAMIGAILPDNTPKETVVIVSEFWLPESER